MAFDFARNDDNPGIPPLRPDLLAHGGTIETPAPRYRIRWCSVAEWLAFAFVVAVVAAWIVATP